MHSARNAESEVSLDPAEPLISSFPEHEPTRTEIAMWNAGAILAALVLTLVVFHLLSSK